MTAGLQYWQRYSLRAGVILLTGKGQKVVKMADGGLIVLDRPY